MGRNGALEDVCENGHDYPAKAARSPSPEDDQGLPTIEHSHVGRRREDGGMDNSRHGGGVITLFGIAMVGSFVFLLCLAAPDFGLHVAFGVMFLGSVVDQHLL